MRGWNSNKLKRAVGVGCCLALAPALAIADDWTQHRGPNRDGLSRERGLLKEWPQSGPRLVWQYRDAGSGYGAVAVAGNRGFVVGNQGMDNEFVQAVDLTTGRKLWQTAIGTVGNPQQQPSYPGARSTPTVDGKLVYAFGSNGDLACVDAGDGKIVWKKSLRAEMGGKPGTWAYSESPLIDGARVIVCPGGDQNSVVALDKRTGAPLWKTALAGETAGYSSAVIAELGGVRQIFAYLGKGLAGLEAETGKLLWRFGGTIDTRFGVHAATPIPSGDLIYSSSAAGGGLARITGSGGNFAAQQVYLQQKAPVALGGAVKIGEHLYGATRTTLVCTEFATGRLVWEDRCVGAASICAADGRLYVYGENGQLALVEATPEGYREKGRLTPTNPPDRGQSKAWAYPALANGRLYVRDLGVIWCYDVKDPAAR